MSKSNENTNVIAGDMNGSLLKECKATVTRSPLIQMKGTLSRHPSPERSSPVLAHKHFGAAVLCVALMFSGPGQLDIVFGPHRSARQTS